MLADDHNPPTSASLIWRAQQGETDAWEAISQIYAPLVDRWIRRAGLQEADARDVAQEVFRAVAQYLKGVRLDRPENSFRGWLWTITRNELRRWFRSMGPQRGLGGTDALNRLHAVPDWVDDDTTLDEFDPDGESETEVVRRAAKLIQNDYDPKTWQAFWRVTVEGEAGTDVAKELDMTSGAVRQAKFRVLRRLREILA